MEQLCQLIKVNLPIKLPDDIDLNQSGNPLENHKNWKNTIYKKTGKPATEKQIL